MPDVYLNRRDPTLISKSCSRGTGVFRALTPRAHRRARRAASAGRRLVERLKPMKYELARIAREAGRLRDLIERFSKGPCESGRLVNAFLGGVAYFLGPRTLDADERWRLNSICRR